MSTISRRDFVKAAAALGAISAASARAQDANERISVGIIGCRNRGTQVADTMLDTGQFDIATVCDCDDAMLDHAEKELAGKASPRREKDFRRLLDDEDIDAVVVAAPDHWHALMTAMALAAGKHVYLEKPASYNIADGKAMVAAHAKHPDLVVQVGTQQRSGAHFQEAKAFIAAGGPGKVAFARATMVGDRHRVPIVRDSTPPAGLDYDMWVGPAPTRPYNKELHHYNWHFLYDFGTGDMGNWGAHWLDVIRWLLGLDLPESVSGYGGQYVVQDAKEWPDTQTVMYHYPETTIVWEQRHWSRFAPGGGEGNCCEISGDKGSILIDRSGWRFFERAKNARPEAHPASELEKAHTLSFAQAIRGLGQPSAPLVEGCKSATLCHLGNIATRLNRSVRFDPASESAIGDDEAAAMMARPYRTPWRIDEYV